MPCDNDIMHLAWWEGKTLYKGATRRLNGRTALQCERHVTTQCISSRGSGTRKVYERYKARQTSKTDGNWRTRTRSRQEGFGWRQQGRCNKNEIDLSEMNRCEGGFKRTNLVLNILEILVAVVFLVLVILFVE